MIDFLIDFTSDMIELLLELRINKLAEKWRAGKESSFRLVWLKNQRCLCAQLF